jgi:hypothetical protein
LFNFFRFVILNFFLCTYTLTVTDFLAVKHHCRRQERNRETAGTRVPELVAVLGENQVLVQT